MASGRPTKVQIRGGIFQTCREPRNRFQGIDSASLCSLAGRYENTNPTWFLVPIDCSKIPAQIDLTGLGRVVTGLDSISGFLCIKRDPDEFRLIQMCSG